MRVLKALIALGLVAAMALPAWAEPAKLVSVFNDFPPYKMTIHDKPAGVDVELLGLVAAELGMGLGFRKGTLDQGLEMMRTGRADIMSSLLKNPEREKYIVFVDPPYMTRSPKAFYAVSGKQFAILGQKSLKGKKVGVKRGAIYFPAFDQATDFTRVEADSVPDLITLATENKIDTFVATVTDANYWINNLELSDTIKKTPYEFDKPENVYFGISRKSPLAADAAKVGEIVQQLLTQGMVKRAAGRWTGIRGDGAAAPGGDEIYYPFTITPCFIY